MLNIVDKWLWGHLDGVMYSQRGQDFILTDRYFQQITRPWLRLTSRPHKSWSVSESVAGLPGKCTSCTLKGKPARPAWPPPLQVWSATCFSPWLPQGLLHVCAAPYPPGALFCWFLQFSGLGQLRVGHSLRGLGLVSWSPFLRGFSSSPSCFEPLSAQRSKPIFAAFMQGGAGEPTAGRDVYVTVVSLPSRARDPCPISIGCPPNASACVSVFILF